MSDCTWEDDERFNDPQPIERYWKLQVAKQQVKRARASTIYTPTTNAVVLTFAAVTQPQPQAEQSGDEQDE